MVKDKILAGNTFLGIELGSTRIKASLIDDTYASIASGSFAWENSFEDGNWTYSLESIHKGIQACFKNLSEKIYKEFDVRLEKVGAIGVSAMMHGYLAFDKDDNLLVPFRTWRNTTTEEAADKLTEAFRFNIPQRWSIAHLYQAILNNEPHVSQIAHITTLAGYVHYLLTGKREVGIGDASGMFPIRDNNYDYAMLNKFNSIIKDKKFSWDIKEILPKVKMAGESGAYLTESGAKFLDLSGILKPGIAVCPPEGDAGAGMVATNAVFPRTGNVSAGTSIFAMVVLEKLLKNFHREIDIVTTPDGSPVAMVHCNNCCGELDTWVKMFGEFAKLVGVSLDKSFLYEMLYKITVEAEANCGGITVVNYLSGEHITRIEKGRPMYFRSAESNMNIANFMRAQIYSSMATLALGMEILFQKENVCIDQIQAHGGLFKEKGIAQQILADALQTCVSVTETAGEGGAWGIALLAAFMISGNDISLGEWLNEKVFAKMKNTVVKPNNEGTDGFKKYLERYKLALDAEKKLENVSC